MKNYIIFIFVNNMNIKFVLFFLINKFKHFKINMNDINDLISYSVELKKYN